MAEELDCTLLHGAQGADEAEQRRLAGARRSGHDDQLPWINFDAIVKQYLVSGVSLAKIVIDPLDAHNGRGFDLGNAARHQKTSAGSAAITPAAMHMTRESARLIAVRLAVIPIGSNTTSLRRRNSRRHKIQAGPYP